MTAPKPPTLNDVAARAGVSPSIVSIVLHSPDRGRGRVGQVRREQILQATRDLGYRKLRPGARPATHCDTCRCFQPGMPGYESYFAESQEGA